MNLVKSLLTLAVSFVIVFLVLYGLVPGFIKVAQQFELLFVNSFHMSYNSGALVYVVVTAAVFVWAIYSLGMQKSGLMIRLSFLAALAISGIFFFGNGFLIGWIILAIVAVLMFTKMATNSACHVGSDVEHRRDFRGLFKLRTDSYPFVPTPR